MKKLVLLLSIFFAVGVNAQHNPSLYPMSNTFQNLYANPSYLPYSGFHLGLPALSGASVRLGFTGFPVGSIIGNSGGEVDVASLVKKLDKQNSILFDNSVELISAGAKFNSLYISLSSRLRISTNFNMPKDLMLVGLEGNGEQFADRPANLSGLALNSTIYTETALGVSFPVGDNLRIGVRGKFLQGIANVATEKSEFKLTTDGESNYAINIQGQYQLRTSGIGEGIQWSPEDALNAFLNLEESNTGFGLDIGATYTFSERVTFSAAIADLGYIKWKNEAYSYQSNAFDFNYSGEDVFALSGEEDSEAIATKLVDSLISAITVDTLREEYTSTLNARFMASGELKLKDKHYVGGVIAGEFVPGNFQPYVTAYYRLQFGKKFGFLLSNSFAYGSALNPGFGLTGKLGPVQLYMASDNFLGLVLPQSARGAQFTAGLNLVFGGSSPARDVIAPE